MLLIKVGEMEVNTKENAQKQPVNILVKFTLLVKVTTNGLKGGVILQVRYR